MIMYKKVFWDISKDLFVVLRGNLLYGNVIWIELIQWKR